MRKKLLSVLIIISVAQLLEKSYKLEIRGDFFNHFPANIGAQHYSIVPKFKRICSTFISVTVCLQHSKNSFSSVNIISILIWKISRYSVQKITLKKSEQKEGQKVHGFLQTTTIHCNTKNI